MLKLILLAVWAATVSCKQNNLPSFSTSKTLDCTENMHPTDPCKLTLVVQPLTSMTYYDHGRSMKGIRAAFDSKQQLVILDPKDKINDKMQHPIVTDGYFRPIITINGQMPGPTIIAYKNQRMKITVYNLLMNAEGITVHWHGMHQIGTQRADGVPYVTQLLIMAGQNYRYDFLASPSGTHWYHAHSGAQRTDGLYGALIIKDDLLGKLYDYDLPNEHTLMLMDWQKDASIDLFYNVARNLGYYKDDPSKDPPFTKYGFTKTYDETAVGGIPFWSGIINDRGRHYDEKGTPNMPVTSLNHFKCKKGNKYRFRLIGVQLLYAFAFRIDQHKLTVIASDGVQIKSIDQVDYVIVNTGERYDVVVNCDQEVGDYMIYAETLENINDKRVFYNPISKHRAEAVLRYDGSTTPPSDNERKSCDSTKTSKSNDDAKGDGNARNDDHAKSDNYDKGDDHGRGNDDNGKTGLGFKNNKYCDSTRLKVVNCPFGELSSLNFNCINVDKFEPYDASSIPPSIKNTPKKTLFYSIGFDGEESTHAASIDGINFRFPSQPPLDDITTFEKATCPIRGCDHDEYKNCACTHIIDLNDLNRGDVIEIVLVNRLVFDLPRGMSHPIHLHGHYFYVSDVEYPKYDDKTGHFLSSTGKVECKTSDNNDCKRFFITSENSKTDFSQKVQWKDNKSPNPQGNYVQKDTVIVPFGGYTAIRFVVDNPGWWLFHCHVEEHALHGMTALIKELQ
ncbi:uncharacterized protein [Dysidea avara]